MFPQYNLEKIKFGTDGPTFTRAVDLYEAGKVTNFKPVARGFSAVVIGTKPYHVFVSARHYDKGNCECYLGQRDVLCKHIVAVAIHAVKRGEPLTDREKQSISEEPKFSGRLGKLSKEELTEIKQSIREAMRRIKPYSGPSKIWFKYQNSLSEGCRRLSAIISELPASKQTAAMLVELLLRLDKKLSQGGVDDSDGTVGGFMYGIVEVLKEYAKADPRCIKAFKKLCEQETCFEWEDLLVRIYDEGMDAIEEME